MTRTVVGTLGSLVLALLPLCGVAGQAGPLGTSVPRKSLGTPVDENAGPEAFLANQLTFERVATARSSTDRRLRTLFEEAGVPYPAPEIYLRVFKHERVLQLWARGDTAAEFALIKEYPVCALPGQLGPKQRMGDLQVPEGFYFIDRFNPRSAYHLSLRVNYPNLADRMRRQALALGGDIYIHGGCETVGCVPIENHNIEEVYWLAAQATDAGQRIIPVHIFPARLDPARLRWLEGTFDPEPALREFWRNLAEGYAYFQETRRVPWITVDAAGRYSVPRPPRLSADTVPADSMSADRERSAVAGPPATDSVSADSLAAEPPPTAPALVTDSIPVDSIPDTPAPDSAAVVRTSARGLDRHRNR
jgi:murein L,D-transpeptidase YafK